MPPQDPFDTEGFCNWVDQVAKTKEPEHLESIGVHALAYVKRLRQPDGFTEAQVTDAAIRLDHIMLARPKLGSHLDDAVEAIKATPQLEKQYSTLLKAQDNSPYKPRSRPQTD